MKILGFDTSGEHLSVFFLNGEKLTTEFYPSVSRRHSQELMPAVERVLQKAGATTGDVQAVACVVGPGSFTGIRIGVSTAKALAFSLSAKLLAITSFETLAYDKPYEKCQALISAKHGNYYACPFTGKTAGEPTFLSATELAPSSAKTVLSDDKKDGFTHPDLLHGFVAAVKEKAETGDFSKDVSPLYVKKPQAEERP